MEQVLDLGKRRIQHIHGSAFINLPKVWIRTNDLLKGDQLRIALQEDGALRISCIDETRESEAI